MSTTSIIIRVSILLISLALHLLINIKIAKKDFKNVEAESKKEINIKDFMKKYWIVQTIFIVLIGIAYVFIFPSTVILSIHRIAFVVCTLLCISCTYYLFTSIYRPHHYIPDQFKQVKFLYIFAAIILLILYMITILSAFISLNLIYFSYNNEFPSITKNKYDLLSPYEIEKEDSISKYDRYDTAYSDENGNMIFFIKTTSSIKQITVDKDSIEYIISDSYETPYIIETITETYAENQEYKKPTATVHKTESTYIVYCNEEFEELI